MEAWEIGVLVVSIGGFALFSLALAWGIHQSG